MAYDNQKQYLEADTDATIRGTAIMWEDAADTLRSVSSAKPLPVAVGGTISVTESSPISGFATDTIQTDGNQKTQIVDTTGAEMDLFSSGDVYTAASEHGLMILAISDEAPNKYRPLRCDGDGRLETHLTNADHDTLEFANEDYDTSGGTEDISKIGIALPADGGSVAGGTASNPIRTDPTGTTTQPISGTVTVSGLLADGHAVTVDNISTNEVFVRGSQSAGSPVDGEVATIQGIASATPVIVTGDSAGSLTVDGTVAVTNAAIDGPAAPSIDSYTQKAINLTTGANQVLVSSAASKQIWVYGVSFSCGDADGQTVSFQDEDDVAITGIMEFVQYGGMAVAPSGNFSMPIWKLGTDKDLEIDITGGDVDGYLTYAIVSV